MKMSSYVFLLFDIVEGERGNLLKLWGNVFR